MAYIKAPKPEQQEMYDYLESLRQSGSTNMFGAGAYLESEFCLGRAEARSILSDWMDGHGDPKRQMDGPATTVKAGRFETTYKRAE